MEKDLQRISVKLFADTPPGFSVDPFLAIFGRWRNETDHPARWVDVADYAHMVQGPGILLVGKQGSFAANMDEPGFGLLYSGKQDFEGDVEQRFLEAFRRALELQKRLVSEPEFPEAVKLRTGDWLVFVNDRLDFPNTDETDELLKPGIQAALDTLFGPGAYQWTREPDPERRYGYRVQANPAPTLDQLIERAEARALR